MLSIIHDLTEKFNCNIWKANFRILKTMAGQNGRFFAFRKNIVPIFRCENRKMHKMEHFQA